MQLPQMIAQALAAHQRGDFAEGERGYLAALEISPDAFDAHFLLGVLLAQQGRVVEAAVHTDEAVRLRPAEPAAWLNNGTVLAAAGRAEEAIGSYERAISLSPGDAEASRNLARTLLDLRRPEAALCAYDRVLTNAPRDLEALNARASILWSLGRADAALADLDDALAVAPDDLEALNNRGNVLRDLGRLDEAVDSYERALAIQPLAETWNNLGVALSELGRHEAALACYERALALDPVLADAWNNRGVSLHEMQRLEEALGSCTRALSISPEFAAALSNIGKVLCESGRIDEAFVAFTRSAKLVYGPQGTAPTISEAPHVRRHQSEQRQYLKGRGPRGAALHLEGGERVAGKALRWTSLAKAEDDWTANEPHSVVIDDLLTPEALSGLRRFCWGSTMWRKPYPVGYLGAFPESGFACPLLAQIAEEFRGSLPTVFGGHELRYLWAFKYDQQGVGTHVHADDAAINVNFWITPDEANLDREGGGLVFWDKQAPAEWAFSRFNADADAAHGFLAESGARRVSVPYKENRAVIFDSRLFHATDTFRFKRGYRNRRINITMLFGRRSG